MNPPIRKNVKTRIKISLRIATVFIALSTITQAYAATSSELNSLYNSCVQNTSTWKEEAECFRSGITNLTSSSSNDGYADDSYDRGRDRSGRGRGGVGRGRARHPETRAFCTANNVFGTYADGGGCNAFGCYYPGGSCNAFGCHYEGGSCNAFGCVQGHAKTKRACVD